MSSYTYTNQPALRAAFWDAHPELTPTIGPRGRIMPQNEQTTDVRAAWVDFVDTAAGNGNISDALANRATL